MASKCKSKKKVGFSDDTAGGEEREGRSRSRSRLRLRRSKSQDIRSMTPKENIPKKRDHSLVSLVRTGSRNSVRHLVKFFETKPAFMNEGRKSQIILPDERRLDIIIQPKLGSRDLLDLVASHFRLKEKEYFGLYYQDETGHFNWLNTDKKVLEHDFPRKTGVLILFFGVRFYVESISCLRDTPTVELFYLNAKHAIFTGQIESDSETVFELAAYVLQATHGDYADDAITKDDLKKLPVIPTSALKEHPSIVYCEDKVIHYYKKLVSSSRGYAIVNYMTIIENLPTYGIHYYEVKDKKDIPWWLGLSHKGIAVYDKTDKTTPRKIFTWKHLENLYYRDKKFSIEVHDPKRVVHTLSSFNLYEDAIREPINEFDELSDAITDPSTQVSVSRRTFGPGSVAVHAWFGSTPQLTKCIWSMAVAQHQFYLDKKHSKTILPAARSISEIAADLSRSTTSLGSVGSDISRSGSSASLPSLTTSRYDLNLEQVDSQKVQREMYQALKARRDALEETLRKKTEELKLLCIKEGELTGNLPKETPLAPGEEPPQIRRRVGTAFSLSSKIIDTDDQNEADLLSKLELEYELQKQITNAAQKLSQDKSISKYVRKQRRQSFHKAQTKLKEMEKKLQDTQQFAARSSIKQVPPSYDGTTSPAKSPEQYRRLEQDDLGKGDIDFPPMMQRSATARELSPTQSSSPQLSPTLSSPQLCGSGDYRPQNNKQMYSPVLTNRSQSSGSNMSNQSEYENVRPYNRYNPGSQDSGFSSANNMYNITTQRTSHYESTDELKTPTNKEHHDSHDTVFEGKLTSKHGSLDGSYRKSLSMQHNYGSLERNTNRRNERPERDRQYSDSEANIQLTDLEPSKYGSKRASQSEYNVNSPQNSVVEVPVAHEEYIPTNSSRQWDDVHKQRSKGWQDTVRAEPSPIIRSPEHSCGPSGTDPTQCYSPRAHEGSFQYRGDNHDQSTKRSESPQRQPKGQSSALVTVTKLQPHQSIEVVSKPFEMSDFYKYSEKIRRQRMIEQYKQQLMGGDNLSRCSTPSQHSSDSGDTSFRHYQGSGGQGSPSGSPYRSSNVANLSSQRQTSPFLQQKRGESYEQSPFPSHTSPKFVKEQSTHVQYKMQTASGARVYKSVQTTTHTQYKPLTPMKCDPIRNQAAPVTSSTSSTSSTRTPSASARRAEYREHHRSSPLTRINLNQSASPSSSRDNSFSNFEPRYSVADDFSEEMLAWYDDSDTKKKPSFV